MLSSVSASFDITLAVIVEIIASILVVAAAMATSHDDEDATAHATTMGLAYGLGAAMTYPVTGAGMNPARSTGIALFARNAGLAQNPMQQLWVFWICPILAAAIVAMVMIGVQLIRDQAAARLTAVQDQETPQDIADEATMKWMLKARTESPSPKHKHIRESNTAERTFQGLRSRSMTRINPSTTAVTTRTIVAAVVYPRPARIPVRHTNNATVHSQPGLPSRASET